MTLVAMRGQGSARNESAESPRISGRRGWRVRLTDRTWRRRTARPGKKDVLLFDEALPGFGLRVAASGSRTFIFQYRHGPKVRRIALGAWGKELTAAAARKKAEALRGQVRDHRDPVAERRAARAAAAGGRGGEEGGGGLGGLHRRRAHRAVGDAPPRGALGLLPGPGAARPPGVARAWLAVPAGSSPGRTRCGRSTPPRPSAARSPRTGCGRTPGRAGAGRCGAVRSRRTPGRRRRGRRGRPRASGC